MLGFLGICGRLIVKLKDFGQYIAKPANNIYLLRSIFGCIVRAGSIIILSLIIHVSIFDSLMVHLTEGGKGWHCQGLLRQAHAHR